MIYDLKVGGLRKFEYDEKTWFNNKEESSASRISYLHLIKFANSASRFDFVGDLNWNWLEFSADLKFSILFSKFDGERIAELPSDNKDW